MTQERHEQGSDREHSGDTHAPAMRVGMQGNRDQQSQSHRSDRT